MDYRHLKPRIHRTTIHSSSRAAVSTMPSCSLLMRKFAAKTALVCLLAVLLAECLPRRTGSAPARVSAWKKSVSRPRTSKPSTQDPNNATLLKTFNDTLWNDLDNAGIFDMVSKSFYPTDVPGSPKEVRFEAVERSAAECIDAGLRRLRRHRQQSCWCRAGSTT